MGNTVSKLHVKFYWASLIIKHSNCLYTVVSIRLYFEKKSPKDLKRKKIVLKIYFFRVFNIPQCCWKATCKVSSSYLGKKVWLFHNVDPPPPLRSGGNFLKDAECEYSKNNTKILRF